MSEPNAVRDEARGAERIRVGVLGANGRMGATVCDAVDTATDMELAATVDEGDPLSALTDACADVAVDFTHPDAVLDNLRFCIEAGVHVVVGTSGFDEARLATVREWLDQHRAVGVLVAPNFALGAVLTMRFAELAARYFETAEVIELHQIGRAHV